MPGFNGPPGAWLPDRLGRSMGDVETLKKQGTEYIVNEDGVTQSIIGNIEHDLQGNATGLTGWGVAQLNEKSGLWTSAELLAEQVEALEAELSVRPEITRGLATLKWAASTDSEILTITHGLAVTPKVVQVSYQAAPAAGQLVVVWAAAVGATTFQAGAHLNGAVSGSSTNGLAWAAIA
jgi:hypothetical protein